MSPPSNRTGFRRDSTTTAPRPGSRQSNDSNFLGLARLAFEHAFVSPVPVFCPRLQSAGREAPGLLFKFRPARVKRVNISLCCFHCGLGGDELGSVACNRRVFQLSPFVFEHLLSL